LKVLSKRKG